LGFCSRHPPNIVGSLDLFFCSFVFPCFPPPFFFLSLIPPPHPLARPGNHAFCLPNPAKNFPTPHFSHSGFPGLFTVWLPWSFCHLSRVIFPPPPSTLPGNNLLLSISLSPPFSSVVVKYFGLIFCGIPILVPCWVVFSKP